MDTILYLEVFWEFLRKANARRGSLKGTLHRTLRAVHSRFRTLETGRTGGIRRGIGTRKQPDKCAPSTHVRGQNRNAHNPLHPDKHREQKQLANRYPCGGLSKARLNPNGRNLPGGEEGRSMHALLRGAILGHRLYRSRSLPLSLESRCTSRLGCVMCARAYRAGYLRCIPDLEVEGGRNQ